MTRGTILQTSLYFCAMVLLTACTDRLTTLRQEINRNPNDHQLRYSLGEALLGKKDLDGAITEFRESLRILPNYPAGYSLSQVLYEKDDPWADTREFRDLVALHPNNGIAHTILGISLADKEDYAAALAEYQEAARSTPNDPLLLRRMGKALIETGSLEQALTVLNKSIEALHSSDEDMLTVHSQFGPSRTIRMNNRELGAAHYHLGRYYEKKGDPQKALAEYQESIRLCPRHNMALFTIGRLFHKEGRRAEAAQMFHAFIGQPGEFTKREKYVYRKQLQEAQDTLEQLEKK